MKIKASLIWGLGFVGLFLFVATQKNSDGLNPNDYGFATRYYDPKLGRFLSADPVNPAPGDPRGYNRYMYVYNNPIGLVDPSGNTPQEPQEEAQVFWPNDPALIGLGMEDMGYTGLDEGLEDTGYVDVDLEALGYTGTFENPEPGVIIGPFGNPIYTEEYGQPWGGEKGYTGLTKMVLSPQGNNQLQAISFGIRGAIKNYHFMRYVMNAGPQIPVNSVLFVTDAANLADLPAGVAPYQNLVNRGRVYPTYAGRSFAQAYAMGRRAGGAQVPITDLLSSSRDFFRNASLYEDYFGFAAGVSRGARLPGILGLAGGGFGISGSFRSDNPYIQGLALGAGSVEVYGALRMLRSASLFAGSSSAAGSASALSGLARGRAALGAGGPLAIVAWITIEIEEDGGWEDPKVDPAVTRQSYKDSGHQIGKVVEPCGGSYCLVEGTQVWTVNGLKKIEEIKPGEFVLTPTPTTDVPVSNSRSEVILVSENEVGHWLQIKTSAGFLNLTENHRVKVRDFGWKLAGEVMPGDHLISCLEGQKPQEEFKVLDVKKVERPAQIYNLKLSSVHQFYVTPAGILVEGLKDLPGPYDFATRYYDPKRAQFINADTVNPSPEHPQGYNRYSYVYNNPFKLADYSGHTPQEPKTPPVVDTDLEALGYAGGPVQENEGPYHNPEKGVIATPDGQIILTAEYEPDDDGWEPGLGARGAWGVSFAARGVMRVNDLRHGLNRTIYYNNALTFLPEGLPVKAIVLTTDAAAFMRVAQTLSEVHGIPLENISFPQAIADMSRPSTFNLLERFKPIEPRLALSSEGFRQLGGIAGRAQLPVLMGIDDSARSARGLGISFMWFRFGYASALRWPGRFAVGGGIFGIMSGIQSDNPYIGGGLAAAGAGEIYGGYRTLKASTLLKSGAAPAVSARAISGVAAGKMIAGRAGVLGLILTAFDVMGSPGSALQPEEDGWKNCIEGYRD